MNTQFVDLHAAADFMAPGAVEINRYESEIFDIVRRRGAFGQRISSVPATGHPSRYFEQTAIASPGAANGFVDPRNIVATVSSPTRLRRCAYSPRTPAPIPPRPTGSSCSPGAISR